MTPSSSTQAQALDPKALEAAWHTKPWRSPDMERCRRATRAAIERGELHRPDTCQRCGARPGLTARGYAGIQAHHHDYSKPLEVEWLCSKCHRAVTPLPVVMGAPTHGEANGQSKLTVEDVRAIRATYQRGVYGFLRLARDYGVSIPTMKQIVRREIWRNVE